MRTSITNNNINGAEKNKINMKIKDSVDIIPIKTFFNRFFSRLSFICDVTKPIIDANIFREK